MKTIRNLSSMSTFVTWNLDSNRLPFRIGIIQQPQLEGLFAALQQTSSLRFFFKRRLLRETAFASTKGPEMPGMYLTQLTSNRDYADIHVQLMEDRLFFFFLTVERVKDETKHDVYHMWPYHMGGKLEEVAEVNER